jgi:hypothetical protein
VNTIATCEPKAHMLPAGTLSPAIWPFVTLCGPIVKLFRGTTRPKTSKIKTGSIIDDPKTRPRPAWPKSSRMTHPLSRTSAAMLWPPVVNLAQAWIRLYRKIHLESPPIVGETLPHPLPFSCSWTTDLSRDQWNDSPCCLLEIDLPLAWPMLFCPARQGWLCPKLTPS